MSINDTNALNQPSLYTDHVYVDIRLFTNCSLYVPGKLSVKRAHGVIIITGTVVSARDNASKCMQIEDPLVQS